jgi:hypothetical protein
MRLIKLITLFLIAGSIISQTYKTQFSKSIIINEVPDASNFDYTIAVPTGLSVNYIITLPSTTGNNNQLLGFNASGIGNWTTPTGSISPGGSDNNVQFKNGTDFNGSDDLFYNPSTDNLGIGVSSPQFVIDAEDYLQAGFEGTSGTIALYSESGATDYTVTLQPNSAMTEDYELVFPEEDGNSSQILVTDGNGNLLWVTQNVVVGGGFPCEDQGTGGGSDNDGPGERSFIGGGSQNSIPSGASDSFIGGGTDNEIEGDRNAIISGANNTIGVSANESVIASGTSNTINSDYSFVASGSFNLIEANADGSMVGSGTNNSMYSEHNAIVNGTFNIIQSGADESGILNGRGNEIDGNEFSLIISGDTNTVDGATLGLIVAGSNNTVSGDRSMIGIGRNNSIDPQVGGDANNSAIMSGDDNRVRDNNSAVLGGTDNLITGSHSLVFGQNNEAAQYALAMGRNAEADDDGSFVFTDSNTGTVNSYGDNTLSMRYTGGYRIFARADTTVQNLFLYANQSSWGATSDSNMKENIVHLDNTVSLDKIMDLPISSWSYKGSNNSVRNYGPMAQDFFRLFGNHGDGIIGTDTTISNMHLSSVGISALKGLNEKITELDSDINTEKIRQTQLMDRIADLEKRVARIQNLKSGGGND